MLDEAVTKPAFKRWGGKPGEFGVAATPKYKEIAYWTHREKGRVGAPITKSFITT